MTYGITGNPHKEQLWNPVAELVSWLMRQDLPFCLNRAVAEGLGKRELVDHSICTEKATNDLAAASDIVLSFGGDGTLLRTAHMLGAGGTPIVGVNIGRLGFLADIDTGGVEHAIEQLEAGAYHVEERMVLQAEARLETDVTSRDTTNRDATNRDEAVPDLSARWALNEFVIDRSGSTGLLEIDVAVDGVSLNTYWADGLIFATPTGSTAYSLSAGGPILAPGTEALILTPIAPHTLTVRPIVLPGDTAIEVRVRSEGQPYVFAADGYNTSVDAGNVVLSIQKAPHTVNLAKLEGQHYFKTLRSKLMWGANAVDS